MFWEAKGTQYEKCDGTNSTLNQIQHNAKLGGIWPLQCVLFLPPPPSKIKRPDKREKMDDKMVKFYVNTEPDVFHSETFFNNILK